MNWIVERVLLAAFQSHSHFTLKSWKYRTNIFTFIIAFKKVLKILKYFAHFIFMVFINGFLFPVN